MQSDYFLAPRLILIIIKASVDVLEQHHRHNRPNHPPSVSRLTEAMIQQESLDRPQPSTEQSEPEPAKSSDSESDTDHFNRRASRHSKTHHLAPRPTTVHFYPGSWQTVLERAKDRFVRHVFVHQAFPVREKDLGIAERILQEEIVQGEAEDLTLDNGKIIVNLIVNYFVTKHI
jgi:hypothetical protein